MTAALLLLLSLFALGCNSDENEPCQLSDCGEYSCRTKQSGDVCYYVIYKRSTFDDARAVCRDAGMALAAPQALPIPHDVIDGLLTIHGAWLSGTARPLKRFAFTNGKTMIMSGSDTDCGAMFSRYNWRESGRVDYFFRPMPCYQPNKFLCRKDNCSPLTPDCVIYDRTARLDWFHAREYCIERGADIFYMEESESHNDLAIAFNWDYHDEGNIFVGLRKRAWVWAVDSEGGEVEVDMKITNWKSGEPNRGYKNCIKLQYTGSWDDQECTSTGPYPLCTREAVRLEEPTQEITTEYETTPYVQIIRKTTTEKRAETTSITPTTTFENTSKITTALDDRFRHTTEGTTYLPPSENEATTTLQNKFEDTTNIPTTSARQTTFYPKTTLGENFEGDLVESTYIPDSTHRPEKSTVKDYPQSTTPKFEEDFETKVKVVTIRGIPVNVDNTRGPSKTTTAPRVPPRRKNLDDAENKDALKTLTKLVLYKIISSSAPTNVPYLCYFIALFVVFRDLFLRY